MKWFKRWILFSLLGHAVCNILNSSKNVIIHAQNIELGKGDKDGFECRFVWYEVILKLKEIYELIKEVLMAP